MDYTVCRGQSAANSKAPLTGGKKFRLNLKQGERAVCCIAAMFFPLFYVFPAYGYPSRGNTCGMGRGTRNEKDVEVCYFTYES